jgi:hypothetical protein
MSKQSNGRPRPADCTDRAVQRQLGAWKTLAERDGMPAARAQATEALIAAAFWFDLTCGRRQAYTLFQQIADQLVEGELAA